MSPARVTLAVPWASSCHTGMSHSSRSVSSTLKQLGWEMSSRLTAPKLGCDHLDEVDDLVGVVLALFVVAVDAEGHPVDARPGTS